jgi:hypothetical protein
VFNEKRIVMTKALLVCGAIAGPLFVVGLLFEGATRANYDPLRHPVSSLALGDYGWVQSANFVVTGLLTLALSVGLRRALRLGKGSTCGPLLAVASSRSCSSSPVWASHRPKVWWIWPGYSSASRSPSVSVG